MSNDRMLQKKVYISLCSIYGNQRELTQTLQSLLPSGFEIYLFLSTTGYLRDQGFPNREDDFIASLKTVIDENKSIRVYFVENTGPYRKLIPILRMKRDEDCFIITVDDDTVYKSEIFQKMAYISQTNNDKCVFNRGFTINMDRALIDYGDRVQNCCSLHYFHTGKGAVLYNPRMFDRTGDLIFTSKSMELAPFADDVWFNYVRIANGISCVFTNTSYKSKDNTNDNALHRNYNSYAGNNKQINAVVKYLDDLGYMVKQHGDILT